MEKFGFNVFTLDDKHCSSEKHCQTSFANARLMHKSIQALWGQKQFDFIILDYFFSPVT
jgi:hypothetical protein